MSSTILPTTNQYTNLGTYVATILKRVEYGVGSLSKLADILSELSISKPFLVTSASLATKTDIIESIKNASGCESVVVFSGIQQHSPIQHIRNAVIELKMRGSDGIIAVGGGSPIDAAKLVIHLYKERNRSIAQVSQHSNDTLGCRIHHYLWLHW
ncbi:unnamed protein product [Rotaria magnacalcarata]|uniref:Alcohol dehydrogenase iron-type/glycerol dehydrogenase GldA domain-containing protein n=2 Tax=Rotaria magnacalcarata TaxID=392030 RepID=A0A816LCF1_9BILA|nr:unnamed protein product [Rotaria magnacalcarata]